MTLPAAVMDAVVVLVAFPAAFRNRTALALVLSWLVQYLALLLSGEFLPPMGGVILDYFVLITILTKPEVRDCSPYPTLAHQFWALVCERSWNDSAVAVIFPLMWLSHLLLDDYHSWWARWWLALAQFLVAGVEAIGPLLRHAISARRRDRQEPPPDALRNGLAGYA
jgi:hypothetical protein